MSEIEQLRQKKEQMQQRIQSLNESAMENNTIDPEVSSEFICNNIEISQLAH